MKTAVISPLGMSPPVISTFIDGIGEPVSDLIIISTDHPEVQAGEKFLITGLKIKFPWLRVHIERLPYDDISTDAENFSFMLTASRIINSERYYYNCDKIYLNIAGGRKNMCVTLALIGQILQVDGVFHVINKNIGNINETLERYRSEIRQFREIENEVECLELYKKNREIFDRLLFPERSTYEIIRMPTLPFPSDYLQYIIHSLKSDLVTLTPEDRKLLEIHGILEKEGSIYHITEHGEAFLGVLLGR